MAGAAAALSLASCAAPEGTLETTLAPVPPAVSAERLVGNWGIGAFHREEDRERTVREARTQCRQAYAIEAGPGGGVIMHLADDPEPRELHTKGASGGRTFLGPAGEAGDRRDREIVSFEDGVMVLAWVDPEVASRYGTLVFVRCEQPARAGAPSRGAPKS